MKKLLPLFVLGTVASASAQVVIDQADFATIGTTITFGDDEDVTLLNLDMGSVGGGQTFDFTILETDGLTDVGFYEPSTVTGGADFPNADMAVDQVGGIFAFAEVTSGEVNIIGLGGDFAGQLGSPIPIVVSLEAENPWTLFEFPASISSPTITDTALFEGKFDSDGLVPAPFNVLWDPDSVHVKRTVYYTAEMNADGVLTDPTSGTHNVLRMNVMETNIDTIWGWTAANGWERPPALVEGQIGVPSNEVVLRTRYISKELGYYVADILLDETGAPVSATFVSDETECCTGIEEVIAANQSVLYPNPTANAVQVRTGGGIYAFRIMDMSGKLLQSELLTVDKQTVDLTGLANGLYVYQMLDESGKMAHSGRLSVIK